MKQLTSEKCRMDLHLSVAQAFLMTELWMLSLAADEGGGLVCCNYHHATFQLSILL